MDWASIIGIGLQFLGQKQASDASVGAASDYNAALIEAAKPKSVYDPTASAIWDEATQSYVLAPSAPMMGLFGANLQDAYRQRALIEDYMKDPESAAQARFAKTDAALAPFRAKEGEGLLSRLLQSGTAGSSLGAEQVAAREMQNRLYDATRLDAERAGVQSDITNYINRSNMAAQNAATYGSIGQNLANIGMGLGSDAYTAAAQGGQGLMNAQAASGFGYGQIPYAYGQKMLGYTKKEADVAEQSRFLSNLGYRQ
jgi:hypothetical protein